MLTLLHFSDKKAEDRPKSPAATSNVDQVPQETPQREAAKSTDGAAVVARGILDCQTVVAVSGLVFEYSLFLVE